MDSLITWIVGSSTTLDVYVIVRLVAMCMGLEMFSVACGLLGGVKGR